MFRHWLIITLRYLRKDARHSMINLLGLTLGLTGAMLITFYIHHGWRYDRHHEAVKAGRTEAAAAEKMAGVFNVVGA